MLVISVVYTPQSVDAQIAPTNTATVSGSVSDSQGKPIANAKVLLSGSKSASTQTDSQGLFVFVGIPFGKYQISVAATALGTATRSIAVESDTNVAIQYEPASITGLKTIANVSSSANASFNVTPASITQVNPIANAFDGQTSWRTILEQIPGVAQAGRGNGQVQTGTLPDSPFVPMQISINGALPYETATLLDDMPLIGGAPYVNGPGPGTGTYLNLYPLNGFATADVVRGPGAAAPSIVDSIGGSFVLHAPGQVSQNHYDFSASTDPYGGLVVNALVAQRWNKLSTIITYGVNDSPGPLNGAGIPAKTVMNPSTVNGQSFSAYSPPCSPPSCAYGSYLLSPAYASASFPYYGYQVGLLTCCINRTTAWSQHSGSAALIYDFSPALRGEIVYAGESATMSTGYPDFTVNFVPPSGYAGGIPAGQYAFSYSGAFLGDAVPQQQASSLFEEKITAQLGRGILRAAALQNHTFTSVTVSIPTSLNVQLFGGGTLNGSPTVFNGGTYDVTYDAFNESQKLWSTNRDFLLSYATPLGANLHAGASYVTSSYTMPCEFFEQFGSFTFGGFTPSDISQMTREMRFFVGGNPSEKTSLDLSMYFANANYHVQDPNDPTGATYTDAHYTYSAPRLGFVWRPQPSIAVRAAAGGGFAEAPLQDLVGSNGMPSNSGLGYYTVTLTNLNLQPEKSFSFDLGTDIRLPRNSVLSVDVYRSNLYGQIYNSTSPSGTYLGLPLYVTQYGNLGESRMEGILVDVRHEAPHGIYWSLSGGLTRGYLVSVPAGFYSDASGACNFKTGTTPDGAVCRNLTVVPNVNFNGEFAGSIPYAQGLGTLGYRWNADKYVDLVGTYYGNNNTYFRPAFIELDGHLRYAFSKNVSFLVTFRNITGIYDGAMQLYSPANLSGAPTMAGLPYPLYGEMYGPRTIILTTNVRWY